MSGYTRRIYVATARILNSQLPDPDDTSERARARRVVIANLADEFADEFRSDWINFDRARFINDALKNSRRRGDR